MRNLQRCTALTLRLDKTQIFANQFHEASITGLGCDLICILMATRCCIPNGERVGQFHFLSASISEYMLLALNFCSLARNNGAVGRKPKIETTCVLSEFIMLSCVHIHCNV